MWLLALALAVRLPFVWIAPNNGEDALSRFDHAVTWLKDPGHLPLATSAHQWLPLHFWLLGGALWLWHSERSARLVTALLGALTILPYWGIVRRVFDRRVAVYASLAFVLFGYHIAYSVTTSSEAPTLFFLVCGVYCWVRFVAGCHWKWCIPGGLTIGAASLIRFDAWIFVPVLTLLVFDLSKSRASLSDLRNWPRAILFGLASGAAAIGWLVFSKMTWGDWMALPHRNIVAIRAIAPALRHSLPFRLVVVPGSLFAALSPLLEVLAAVGIVWVLADGRWIARGLAILAITMFAWTCCNSVFLELTAARYTLMYDWLLFPFAFEALRRLTTRRPKEWPQRKLYAATLILFVLWEAACGAVGHYGPAVLADHLGAMSPALEPHVEVRGLTRWLRQNVSDSDALVMDEFSFESSTILQLSGISPLRAFQVGPDAYTNPDLLGKELSAFIRSRHPEFAVLSPDGPIGRLWSLDDRDHLDLPQRISLSAKWRGQNWSVYSIRY
jgi:4-amino-4-deoxy-L-arabinose transferase-like glycosyltransferase